jgi:opacity protein-like surface antigen
VGSKYIKEKKGGNMKNVLAVVVLALCVAVPSFAADVVGHSVKVTGKETYKAAKVSAKDTAKAGKAVAKALF